MKYIARNGLLLVLVMVFLAIFPPLKGMAATYTIQGIKVDVTAETAVEARAQALKKAQISAVDKLLKSIVLKQDQDKIPTIDEDQIESFIKTYSVEGEKLTGTRYLATYQFSVLKDQVNAFLNQQNIQPLAYEQKKILIIPAYTNKEETLTGSGLWHENWKTVLSEYKDTYIVPLFDIEDQFKIKSFIDENSGEGLKEFLHKYGADSLVIMWLKNAPENDHLFAVESYTLDDQHSKPSMQRTDPFWMPEDNDQVQGKINQLIEEFQEKEKHKTIDNKSLERRVLIQVSCNNIECVNAAKNDLYSIKNIKTLSITEADSKKITYSLVYEGKFKILQKQLERKMYKVSFTDTGILIEKMMQNDYDNS
tara:strand:- start:13326 stop:14420 length:1095 start_codon:yes stop_codon:yes gene_type:complete